MKTEVLDAGSIQGYDEEVDVLVVGLYYGLDLQVRALSDDPPIPIFFVALGSHGK